MLDVNSGCVFYLIGKASKKQFPFDLLELILVRKEFLMEVHDLSRSLESISWGIYENVKFLSHIGKVRPCNQNL